MALASAPLDADRLADRTADRLRSMIVSGELRAGQRLVEWQLAQQFGVSRGPIREAFKQLSKDGLLNDVPRRGTYVVVLSPSDVRDLMDLRAGVEACAARLFVQRNSSEQLAELDAAVRHLEEACISGDQAEISSADYIFHEAVCRETGNSRLHAVFVRYVAELRVLLRSDEERLHEEGTDISGQHAELLSALRARDPDIAAAAFRRHVEQTRDRLLSRLEASPGASKAPRSGRSPKAPGVSARPRGRAATHNR